MKIVMATKNTGKINQIKQILRLNNINLDIVIAEEIGFNEDINETGKTFEENSEIKSRAIYDYCINNSINDVITLGDDSGLCVDKLDGYPGVFSARFAGNEATDDEKRAKIIELMKEYHNKEDRTACFRTVLTAILPDGKVIQTSGKCRGTIADKIGKVNGKLTYNPIFIPNGFDKPISEMNESEFSKVHNHREQAVMELVKELNKYYTDIT